MLNSSVEILGRYTNHSDGYNRLYLEDGRVVGEHRFIMARAVGRELSTQEHVHHLDGNRRNNALSNLQLLSASEHAKLHNATGETTVGLECVYCGVDFAREVRQVNTKRSQGQKNFYCSRSCMGKHTWENRRAMLA